MKIDEENFIQHLRKRNEDALDYVIENYGGLIKAIIRKHLYHLQAIHEECIDDVLLAVWDHIHSFREEKSSFKNWLAAIATYKSIDYKRKYVKYLQQQDIETVDIRNGEGVETRVLENELSAETDRLLNNLTEEDKQIFIHYYVEQEEVGDIARDRIGFLLKPFPGDHAELRLCIG